MAPELPDVSLAAAGRRLKGLMLVASRRGSVATLSGACDHVACPSESATTMPSNHLLDTTTVMR